MEQFNHKLAEKGMPLITRSGVPARFLKRVKHPEFPIVVEVLYPDRIEVLQVTFNGRLNSRGFEDSSDIFMDSPLKDNRLVNDTTFAIRLKSFVKDITVCDAMAEEEKEYLEMVADKLLKHQCLTATTKEEVEYLKRNNVYDKYVRIDSSAE